MFSLPFHAPIFAHDGRGMSNKAAAYAVDKQTDRFQQPIYQKSLAYLWSLGFSRCSLYPQAK